MSDLLEDMILTEAHRQGIQPNVEAMRLAAVDLAGASLTAQNLIYLPGKGSISPADYVRSLHAQAPERFSNLGDKPVQSTGHTGLTARYIAELSASKRKPIDASRFSGLTRRYLEENLENRK